MIRLVEKYMTWTFKGSFLSVYLKWVIIGIISTILLFWTCLPHSMITWVVVKAEFFVCLYIALIPAIVSRELNKEKLNK